MSEIELYNPDIQYKAGKDNIIPDLLSRRDGPDCIPTNTSVQPKYLYNTVTTNNPKSLSKAVKSIKDDPIQDWPLLFFCNPEQWPPSLRQDLLKQQPKFLVKNQHIYKLSKTPKTDEVSGTREERERQDRTENE
ncbi:hypothetical protein INT47_005639 [Mucor saturninus]|uniref:Uncharacterized protein n=1 Tax=Mucor saturninus TaxID=64648 RepID=A0A8H7QDK5_9FUNG|nr:hypothetical protein INT47_005639 [Mucor saturninus]